MTRIPLATDLKTRTLAPDKDARLKNCYIEGKGDPQSQDYQTMVRKRPAATGGFPVGTGVAQGGVGSPTGLTVVTADTLNTTITANTTLTTQSNVIAAGSPTIALPTSPTSGQSVSICNVGSGTITVSTTGTTIPAWSCAWFIWGGYSWGISVGPTCTLTLPSTHDFGTVQFAGPSDVPYSVPAPTVTYSTLGYTPCGGQIRKIVTKTYSSRSVTNQYILAAGVAQAVAYLDPGYSPTNSDRSHGLGIGATAQAAIDMAASTISAPARFDYTPDPRYYSLLEGGNAGVYCVVYGNYYNGGRTGGSWGWTVLAPVLGIAYYLDVHEVWTYDVI